MLHSTTNIYNNLLDQDDILSDEEDMIFQMDFNQTNDFDLIDEEFNKLLGYDKQIFLDLINGLDIYKDLNNLNKFKKFFLNFNKDFSKFISVYGIREKIYYLLKKESYNKKINYNDLLKHEYLTCNYIKNILLLSDDEICYLINKYNNISLNDDILPLDPITNLSIDSSNKFNLSNDIISFLSNSIDNESVVKFKILEILIKKISNTDFIIRNIINDLKLYDLTDELIKKTHDKITSKIEININELMSDDLISEEYSLAIIINIIIFKLIIENHNTLDCDIMLTKIYCSSNILLLEMIQILKPELLDINLLQLQKIIYYGRYKVFLFLMENIPWKIMDILSQSNPFNLEQTKISYIDDLWNFKRWHNDEFEKPIIGENDFNHEKLIEYILMIVVEKNYTHVCWTDEIKKYWINLSIDYKKNRNNQSTLYFIDYDKLLKIFNLSFDFTSKESIKSHIEIFGRKTTWEYLSHKYKTDDSILDILMS